MGFVDTMKIEIIANYGNGLIFILIMIWSNKNQTPLFNRQEKAL